MEKSWAGVSGIGSEIAAGTNLHGWKLVLVIPARRLQQKSAENHQGNNFSVTGINNEPSFLMMYSKELS